MIALASGFATALIVKVSIVLGIGLLIVALARRLPADVKHALYLVALGSTLLLPVASVAIPRWNAAILPEHRVQSSAQTSTDVVMPFAPVIRSENATVIVAHAKEAARANVRSASTVDWRLVTLACLWLVGTCALLLRTIAGRIRLDRIARGAVVVDSDAWREMLEQESQASHIARKVSLLASAAATTPVTWGSLRPVIVLPSDAERWPEDRRRIVLRHELAHIARGDALAQLFAALACSAFWFHPLVWFTAYRLRIECERASDDRVLSSGTPGHEYAQHLLSLTRSARALGGAGFVSLAMAHGSQTEMRIREILDPGRRRIVLSRRLRDWSVAAAMFVVLLLSACNAVIQRRRSPVLGVTSMKNGVTTVQHGGDAFARAPGLITELIPLAEMRGRLHDARTDLERVGQVVILPDGRYAAFRSIDPRVFVFSRDGKLEQTIGQLGQGVGDFMRPTGMVLLGGDTLYIPDEANMRAFWITPGKGIVRSVALTERMGTMFGPRGVLPDGRLVYRADYPRRAASATGSTTLLDVAVSTQMQAGFHVIDSASFYEMTLLETRYRGHPRAEPAYLRFGRSGDVAVWDSLVAVGTAEHGYEIETHDANGKLVGRLRVPVRARRVTQSMRDAVIASDLAGINDPIHAEQYVDIEETRRLAREGPFADSLPAYAGIFTTKNGTLWVVDASAPGDSGWNATAFRHDGAVVGRLHSLRGGKPVYFTDDRVIVREVEVNRNVSLRVYRIVDRIE